MNLVWFAHEIMIASSGGLLMTEQNATLKEQIDDFIRQYSPLDYAGNVIDAHDLLYDFSFSYLGLEFNAGQLIMCLRDFLDLSDRVALIDHLDDAMLHRLNYCSACELVLSYFRYRSMEENLDALIDHLILWKADYRIFKVFEALFKHNQTIYVQHDTVQRILTLNSKLGQLVSDRQQQFSKRK